MAKTVKTESENVTRGYPGERACGLCNEYSAHMRHDRLVYQWFYDANGGYHRHISYCPDLGLRDEGKQVN